MGKFKACVVTFKQGQEVFREGERVSGVVMVEVTEAVVVKAVRVYCYGESLTKWSKDFSRDWDRDQISKEKYFAQSYHLFGRRANQEGPNHTLTVGKHRWNFAFRLPQDRLPSSFEGEYGAIRWYVKVEVDKPFPSINNKWYRPFTVLSQLNINDSVYQPPMKKEVSKTVSKALGIGNAGSLSLKAQTDHFGYCPGEAIFVTVEAKNESTKDMGKISVTLIQKVKFTANDEVKDDSTDIISLVTERTVAKGTTMTLSDIQLRIPAVPPSTRKRTCHHILCTYTVQVCVHVPWGLKLEADIPIAIGTVPRGYRVPPQQPSRPQGAAAAAAAQSPAERPIPYRKCEKGIIQCSKSHDTFPNLRFTPSTVFLSPTQAQTPAAPAATPKPTTTPTTKPTSASPRPQRATAAGMTRSAAPPVTVTEKAPYGACGGGLPNPPAYTLEPSAPPLEMELPPAYEDVMRMEEEKERAAAQTQAATKVPEGRKCNILLVRFPDSSLPAFRQAIQREQNNLLDSGEAFLAALAPQPMSALEKAREYWPDHYSLALLVFPDEESAEDWVRGLEEKGDNWYSDCDILLSPVSWSVPEDVSDRLVFSITVARLKEGVSKEQITAFSKTFLPLFVSLRQKHGGVRQSVSKKAKVLHGNWASNNHSISVVWWPKARNYMAYSMALLEEEYAKHNQLFSSLFESQPTLLISEDVTSLSTQPTTSPDDDVTAGYDDDEENAEEEEESGRVENLLDSQSLETGASFD